ncbi:hypothetical protein V2J09_018888 [Rumex salicifolius]
MARTTKRTMTMNWDDLAGNADDDPDEFFESNSRISSVVPLDFRPSSAAAPIDLFFSDDDDDDDNQFVDTRMSFTVHPLRKPSSLSVTASVPSTAPMQPFPSMDNYGVWMAAPGNIQERRKRLLQGMGINSNKDLSRLVTMRISKKFTQNQRPPPGPFQPPSAASTTAPPPQTDLPKIDPKLEPHPSPGAEISILSKTADEQSSSGTVAAASSATVSTHHEVVLFRSRSEGEIESESFHTKRRREEMIGRNVSKQRLTRSASTLTPLAKTCLRKVNSIHKTIAGACNSPCPPPQLDAFFLIKNLDTGKEFIVKEFDQDGMWNRLSDLQTGKQLSMDEFEKNVAGYSPVVKELMRRQNVSRTHSGFERKMSAAISKSFRYSKKRGASLLKNLKSSVSSNFNAEKEMAAIESKAGPKSEWVKVRQQGKTYKELTALRFCQEIQAHEGSIWTMKFNVAGTHLATAGEDKVIHVWEVQELETATLSPNGGAVPDYVQLPETVFGLSEKPVCSFTGHLDDVLDVSWSASNLQLLSSSMDKTVRLWDLEANSCLKLFAHNDYVTCIQFNPVDDNMFISGSLDAKLRIWNVLARRVVDWVELHEMVTAACFSPDGQSAIAGSHKGNCRMYSTSEGKLSQLSQFSLPSKNKKLAKITGFEFTPEAPSEVLITSADSRIRIYDGQDMIHKFVGFQNVSSQIAASYSPCGRHVICASEDSHVYVWKREEPRQLAGAGTAKAKTVVQTRAYEQFQCKDVSVAIPWPGCLKFKCPEVSLNPKKTKPPPAAASANPTSASDVASKKPPLPKKPKPNANNTEKEEKISQQVDESEEKEETQPASPNTVEKSETEETLKSGSMKHGDTAPPPSQVGSSSPAWTPGWSWRDGGGSQGGDTVQASAWGMAIVTAGLSGEIRAYQNFGLPVKIGKQKNLFS